MYRTLILLLPLFAAGPAPSPSAPTEKIVIKCATVAPDGSTWMVCLDKMNKDLFRKTRGRVTFKFFAGGIAGEEKTVLEKMEYGQLQAAGLTGIGMGEILPEVRLLELPYMIQTYEEYDHVLAAIGPEFEAAYEEKGYVILAWAEAGFARLFSQKPIRDADDVAAAKVWLRTGDPLNEIAMEEMGIQPVPLALSDVLTSLQTGLIDTVYISPLAAIALQWFPHLRYCSDVPLFNIEACLILKKDTFDKLSEKDRATLQAVCDKHLRGLVEQTRRENRESIEILKSKGVEFLSPTQDYEAELNEIRTRIADALTGPLIERDQRERLEKLLAEFRGSN